MFGGDVVSLADGGGKIEQKRRGVSIDRFAASRVGIPSAIFHAEVDLVVAGSERCHTARVKPLRAGALLAAKQDAGQVLGDVVVQFGRLRSAGERCEGRVEVEVGGHVVDDARFDMTRPSEDARHAESALPRGPLKVLRR